MTSERRKLARERAERRGPISQSRAGLDRDDLIAALDEIDRLERELAAVTAERDELLLRSRPGPTEAEDQPTRGRRRR